MEQSIKFMVGNDNAWAKENVSVLKNNKFSKPSRQDVHMNIILEHKEQIQINTVSDDKPVSYYCCTRDKETPFVNEHEIDHYIDRYFLLHVPDTLRVAENHRKVYQLIHELVMEENELKRFERDQKAY